MDFSSKNFEIFALALSKLIPHPAPGRKNDFLDIYIKKQLYNMPLNLIKKKIKTSSN